MTHRTFDPVSSFQTAKKGALQIQSAEQAIAGERVTAPIRNQLAALQLEQAQVGAQRSETQFGQQQALQRATILGQSAKALRGLPLEQRDAAFTAISPQLEQFGIDLSQFPLGQFTDVNLDNAIAQAAAFINDPSTLTAKQQEFESLTAGLPEEEVQRARRIRLGLVEPQAIIPVELTRDLSPGIASKASAAFTAAGGGKDGLKAFTKIVDQGTEQERRASSPEIIRNNFPTATPAELNQLQATMDAAKTTESGLKATEKVRTEQRRTKKAKTFQTRTLDLINSILGNDQLGDVLGSIEGAIDIRLFSDAEAELIADIKEVQDLLTADNLDLMSGVLTDKDIEILKNLAGGALTRTRTEKRFVKDVTELRDRLSLVNVTTIDDRSPITGGQQTPIAPPSGRQGGQLMTDAQGNRAFVFPDRTFEEVP